MGNTILKLYKNDRLRKLISQYCLSVNQEADDWYTKSIKDLETKRYLIPVLGVQGSGKSSLLNSMLFNDIVLPVDAAETTCIPTEISFTDSDKPVAKVVFNDGRSEGILCERGTLAFYVHQEHNPGNQKGVSRIEIGIRHELLKDGLVLVDLPGIGSITKENQNTTMEYFKMSTGAIFLLRTVPPMTGQESVFIQLVWPLMSNAFFVQNQWADESAEEVTDGRDHSLSILKSIAKTIHFPSEDITIDTICIIKAMNAVCTDDAKKLEESQLHLFIEKLIDFSQQWRSKLGEILCLEKSFKRQWKKIEK
jgi:hypothetical protein